MISYYYDHATPEEHRCSQLVEDVGNEIRDRLRARRLTYKGVAVAEHDVSASLASSDGSMLVVEWALIDVVTTGDDCEDHVGCFFARLADFFSIR